MTNGNNDIEELEELLTELEGQEAQLVSPYSEDDDAVTQLMDAPVGDQEWMVQVTAIDRRMMATDQLLAELRSGKISEETLVWRGGMDDWLPISKIEELRQALRQSSTPVAAMPPAELPPPPAPLPAQPAWSAPHSSPASAPLPPPPAPAASLPPPPAPLPPPPVPHAQTNTTRPVAVDFSDMPQPDGGGLFQGKKAVLVLSAVAVVAVVVTAYAFSAGDEAPAVAATAAAPQALQPAEPQKPSPEPSEAKQAEPEAQAANDEADEAEEDDGPEASESTPPTRAKRRSRSTAPAKYSVRSRSTSRRAAARPEVDEADEPEAEEADEPETLAEAMKSRAGASDDAPEEPKAAEEEPEPPSSSARSSSGGGGKAFDRAAVKAALQRAAEQARNCQPQGGPSGTGQVQVVYEPSGRVASVSILSSKFENTTTGSCVRMLFRRARVPEFSGGVVKVNKSFEIP